MITLTEDFDCKEIPYCQNVHTNFSCNKIHEKYHIHDDSQNYSFVENELN